MLSAAADNLDPCGFGMIHDEPLSPEATGAILVYPDPEAEGDPIDTLVHQDKVWVCESVGEMIGVVYASDPAMDCALSSPATKDRPYAGPCRQGWVRAEWVQVIAG